MQPWHASRPDELLSAATGLSASLDLRPGDGRLVVECRRGGAGARLGGGGPHLNPDAAVLDLCCGSGEAAAPWLEAGYRVTGLDISPRALALAAQRHPAMTRVEGLAEDPPLADGSFAAIQLSVALHEFPRSDREAVLRSCLRLLQPGGWLVVVDLHPAGPWLQLPQQLFCALFETDTATAMLEDDLPAQLKQLGFSAVNQELLAGQALQRITATRSAASTS